MDKMDYETYDTIDPENSDSPAKNVFTKSLFFAEKPTHNFGFFLIFRPLLQMYHLAISQESKAAKTSSKSRAAVAFVVVVSMILGLTNVVLNTYTLKTGHSSKDVKREVNPVEQVHNDTEKESER